MQKKGLDHIHQVVKSNQSHAALPIRLLIVYCSLILSHQTWFTLLLYVAGTQQTTIKLNNL